MLATESAESIRWNVSVSNANPVRRYAILVFALLAGLSGIAILGHWLFGALGFVIILAVTAEYWLGVRYKVDSSGVTKQCGISVSSIDWADVKRVNASGNEVFFSPLGSESRMDAFRGVTVRTTDENRDRVLDLVRNHWSGDVRFLD